MSIGRFGLPVGPIMVSAEDLVLIPFRMRSDLAGHHPMYSYGLG